MIGPFTFAVTGDGFGFETKASFVLETIGGIKTTRKRENVAATKFSFALRILILSLVSQLRQRRKNIRP